MNWIYEIYVFPGSPWFSEAWHQHSRPGGLCLSQCHTNGCLRLLRDKKLCSSDMFQGLEAHATIEYYTAWWLTYPSEKYEFVSWDDEIPN